MNIFLSGKHLKKGGIVVADEIWLQQCAPTLAGIKTASLFGHPVSSMENALAEVRSVDRRLSPKGVRAFLCCYRNGRALIYVYRPDSLRADFADVEVRQMLQQFGYRPEREVSCLAELRRRISSGGEFPHEIGLFLGYPSADVRGFIENHGEKAKLVGTWKVYSDPDRAEKTFARYKKCVSLYLAQHAKGRSLEQLTVAPRKNIR